MSKTEIESILADIIERRPVSIPQAERALTELRQFEDIERALPILVERWRVVADNLTDKTQAQALRDCANDLAFVLDGDA
jgi:hypothetical protein